MKYLYNGNHHKKYEINIKLRRTANTLIYEYLFNFYFVINLHL